MSGKQVGYEAYNLTDEEIENLMTGCYCDLKGSVFCDRCMNNEDINDDRRQ